ncbi:MAG: amidase [Cryobacterium sp.]|nr:amidase [Cryobacterium sp.]
MAEFDLAGMSPLSATKIADLVSTGELAPNEPAIWAVEALQAVQEELHTAITIVERNQLDESIKGRSGGPLAGVPILVKDQIDTAGIRTTYGSTIFKDNIPDTDAEVVDRLKQAGAVIVGKANQHEFAWGLTSTNPHWGNVVNPRDQRLTPGGSSGGNAAAIASKAVPLGIGTDTAGSLRVPAACCEVVGFKPSNGIVSLRGVFPLSPTLDCVGPIASSVEDCALAFSVLSGQEPVSVDVASQRISVNSEELRSLLQWVGVEARLVETMSPPAECARILPFEAWEIHKDLVAQVEFEYDPNVLAKVTRGSSILEEEYREALDKMLDWRSQVSRTTESDLIVSRVLDVPVPKTGVDELSIRESFGRNTRWVNILGWAAIAIGPIQISGPSDWAVLGLAKDLESTIRDSFFHGNSKD